MNTTKNHTPVSSNSAQISMQVELTKKRRLERLEDSNKDLLAACEAASKVFDSILGMAYNPTNQPAMELRAKIQKADNAIKDAITKSSTL